MSLEKKKFEFLLKNIDDKIIEFFYYDRKECDSVNQNDIEELSDEQYDIIMEKFEDSIREYKG